MRRWISRAWNTEPSKTQPFDGEATLASGAREAAGQSALTLRPDPAGATETLTLARRWEESLPVSRPKADRSVTFSLLRQPLRRSAIGAGLRCLLVVAGVGCVGSSEPGGDGLVGQVRDSGAAYWPAKAVPPKFAPPRGCR